MVEISANTARVRKQARTKANGASKKKATRAGARSSKKSSVKKAAAKIIRAVARKVAKKVTKKAMGSGAKKSAQASPAKKTAGAAPPNGSMKKATKKAPSKNPPSKKQAPGKKKPVKIQASEKASGSTKTNGKTKAARVKASSKAASVKASAKAGSSRKAPVKKTPAKAQTKVKTNGSRPIAAKANGRAKGVESGKSAESPSAERSPAASLVGKKAPDFELKDQSGSTVSSASLRGKPYVLYFYPKDNTPGCTQESCDFRDGNGNFLDAGVTVFGVSPDSTKSHAGFAQKYELPFSLLSDPDKDLANAYGTWALKKNYGKEYWGIVRSTFLIGADGKVKKEWRGVRVNGHVSDVLAEATA